MNTHVQTPTPQLDQSIDFYSRLNFEIVSKEPLIVSDGQVYIEINPDRFARAGIKMYKDSWHTEIAALEKKFVVVGGDGQSQVASPAGCWVYLVDGTSPIKKTSSINKGITGTFAGLSLESGDFNRSLNFWDILGFEKTMGSAEQGWIALQNGDKMGVSIMKVNSCPHLFFNPSMTFFNGGNNLENIEKIRKNDIPITEEITHFNKEGIADNIIIRDPGGYGFFIFND